MIQSPLAAAAAAERAALDRLIDAYAEASGQPRWSLIARTQTKETRPYQRHLAALAVEVCPRRFVAEAFLRDPATVWRWVNRHAADYDQGLLPFNADDIEANVRDRGGMG